MNSDPVAAHEIIDVISGVRVGGATRTPDPNIRVMALRQVATRGDDQADPSVTI